VDLEEGVVRVRRTLTPHKARLLLAEPKTKRSRRTVRLSETAVEALNKHLARQVEEKKSIWVNSIGTRASSSRLREAR
jgi:integrase